MDLSKAKERKEGVAFFKSGGRMKKKSVTFGARLDVSNAARGGLASYICPFKRFSFPFLSFFLSPSCAFSYNMKHLSLGFAFGLLSSSIGVFGK
jgi:hypothetical protein